MNMKKRKNINAKIITLFITLMLLFGMPTQVFALTYFGTPQTLDSSGDVGKYTSLEVINGNPAVSYYYVNSSALKFVRANDSSGTTWGTPLEIYSNSSGKYNSLAVVNGRPAISFFQDSYPGSLKFVRADDANGTSWGSPITVDDNGNVGAYTSLVVVNGRPAISYYSYESHDLLYVRAEDENGDSWGTPQTLDSDGMVGLATSLTVVDGYPAVSYYDSSYQTLKYVRAEDENGDSWGEPVTVDNSGKVGASTSLVVVDGHPAISYCDKVNGYLMYIRAEDETGTAWGTPLILDSNGFVGIDNSLALVNGKPAISYYDLTNGDLKIVLAKDADGTDWNSPQALDTEGRVGQFTSLAEVNGKPAVSYYDLDKANLKYIRVGESVDIALSNGAAVVNNGGMLDFGSTTLNNPVTQTLTVHNNGDSPLDLTQFSLPNGFSFTGSFPTEVGAHSSEDINIRLEANQTGTFSGNLDIGSNDSNLSPYTIVLKGEVTDKKLETGLIAPLDGSTVIDSKLQVAFNHDVLHDGSANAADNAANYLLVEEGANGVFETGSCAVGVSGDDVEQTINSVSYDSSTFTATLNTGTLPSGRYKLLVCGTSSIEDLTGNVLNGGAYDSTTAFTVVSTNSGSENSSNNTGSETELLPATGFAPGQLTLLPDQSLENAYSEMDSLRLQIPGLDVDAAIVGVPKTDTGWDVTWLSNAQAGWLNGTAYPTWEGNTVLTAHVVNASGNPGPFARIKSLGYEDEIVIEAYGDEYVYEVRENRLVLVDNLSVIEKHEEHDWVTLVTCEYFNESTGQYLFRRVVRAVLVRVE